MIINLWLDLDLGDAIAGDALVDTVDYKNVSDRISATVERSHFKLIETLAHHIFCELTTYSQLTKIKVEVSKPGALRKAECASVTAYWKRAQT